MSWMRRAVQGFSRAERTAEHEAQDAVASGQGRARVLCVDDNPEILRLLKRQLGPHFEVVVAQSGADGLDLIANDGPFDVIISDLRMPELHGLAFLKQARALAPDTDRIILTGHADPTTLNVARGAGRADRLFIKPWSRSELIEAIDGSVARRRTKASA